jgi:hypothetical protein
VLAVGYVQLLRVVPSQVLPHVPEPAQFFRDAWGAPTTAVQVPTSPPTSQASHWPLQALLQHTPSTQKPEPHSAALLQVSPGVFTPTHAPLTHTSPLAHWLAPVHWVRHAVAPQA